MCDVFCIFIVVKLKTRLAQHTTLMLLFSPFRDSDFKIEHSEPRIWRDGSASMPVLWPCWWLSMLPKTVFQLSFVRGQYSVGVNDRMHLTENTWGNLYVHIVLMLLLSWATGLAGRQIKTRSLSEEDLVFSFSRYTLWESENSRKHRWSDRWSRRLPWITEIAQS